MDYLLKVNLKAYISLNSFKLFIVCDEYELKEIVMGVK